MVILAVIVSNVICMVFILESSKKQITDSVKHTMVDVVNTTSKIMEMRLVIQVLMIWIMMVMPIIFQM